MYDYMLLIISLVCIIIFFHYCVSLCRIHLSLNIEVYALPIVGLHALPNGPHILTAGLQLYKHTSVDAPNTYIYCD